MHFPRARRVSVATAALSALATLSIVTAGHSQAATTPPTFGPQFDVGSGYSQPIGVAVDGSDNVYVVDQTANTVYRVPADGGPITQLGSGLRFPMAVAVGPFGDVYVADWGNGRVVKIAHGTGVQSTVGSDLGPVDGVAVDSQGNVFAGSGGSVLWEPVNFSTFMTLASGFGLASQLAVNPTGGVYVADSSNASPQVVAVALDGTQTVVPIAGLQNPNSVAVDAGGNLFVANSGANKVLMVTPGGDVSTVGSGYIFPEGVAVNSMGDVIVADTYFPRVSLNPSADPQTITLDHALRTRVTPHTSAVVSATGGGSGNPVTVSVNTDQTYPAGACTLSAKSTRVQYRTVGTCVLDFAQAGSLRYLAANKQVSVTIRPAGLTRITVSVVSPPSSVVSPVVLSARGQDATGQDLGDVTPITNFTLSSGSCDHEHCSAYTAGRATITATAAGHRATTSVTVALFAFVYSQTEMQPVDPVHVTVGSAVDDLIVGAFGGSSGTYKFAVTAGSLPPGVYLRASGAFRGAPTQAGSYPFTILVRDASDPSQRASVVSTFEVAPAG